MSDEVGEITYFSKNIIFWEIPNYSLLSRRIGRVYSPPFCFSPPDDIESYKRAFKSYGFQFDPFPGEVGLILSSANQDSSNKNFKFGIVNSKCEEIASGSGQWIEDEPNSGHFRVRQIAYIRKLKDICIRIFIEDNNTYDSVLERGNDFNPHSGEWFKPDLIIEVKDQVFYAHKKILRDCSKRFFKMLSNDPSTISVTEYDPRAFKLFLGYIYYDKITCYSTSIVSELYCIAHEYIVKDLKEKCIPILKNLLSIEDLSVENFFDIFILFIKYRESELQEHITKFFTNNFETIVNTDKWLSVMRNHTTEARKLLLDAFELKD